MNYYSKKSLIPEPLVNERKEFNARSERFVKKKQFKLPQIHNPIFGSYNEENINRSKYRKKNSSQRNMSSAETSSNYSSDYHRPGSLNNSTNSYDNAVIKRFHSTGQMHSRMENDLIDSSSLGWPLRNQDRFTEGYLKMQSLMNSKRDDIIKKTPKNLYPQNFKKQPLSSLTSPLATPLSFDSRIDSACTKDLDHHSEYLKMASFTFICFNRIQF